MKTLKDGLKFRIFYLLIATLTGCSDLPLVHDGKIVRLKSFKSDFIISRHVDVWLPPGYNINESYPVLYMHDGQMLFDASSTWNHQEWEVDETISRLLIEESVIPCIVVGIWNGGELRHNEYFPMKPFQMLSESQRDVVINAVRMNTQSVFTADQIYSDEYLKFIVSELKPVIDRQFATKPEREYTFIAGSSMGALISLYALCEYPEVFAGAACLSTHWPGIFHVEDNPIPNAFVDYLSTHLPKPGDHRIYFDFGTQGLDALYPPLQEKVDSVMIEKGYSQENWRTLAFEGEDHSEDAWNRRLHFPFKFLLGTHTNE
ncbi:alpha/beta hydrolase [Alkaliflexus imshenetskii]|uniref:alpha/beta hydrolase n=1 Tax=Alkaliflexus imshenetskii TaxID=286730 RepID=UPI0004BCDCC6|nr:alpha/beta hydrolase-fold protein [Alkaliflexus imshenetskii]